MGSRHWLNNTQGSVVLSFVGWQQMWALVLPFWCDFTAQCHCLVILTRGQVSQEPFYRRGVLGCNSLRHKGALQTGSLRKQPGRNVGFCAELEHSRKEIQEAGLSPMKTGARVFSAYGFLPLNCAVRFPSCRQGPPRPFCLSGHYPSFIRIPFWSRLPPFSFSPVPHSHFREPRDSGKPERRRQPGGLSSTAAAFWTPSPRRKRGGGDGRPAGQRVWGAPAE